MRRLTLKLLFSLFILSKTIISQTSNFLTKSEGFIVIDSKVELLSSDKSKIEAHNFDEYRFYSIRKKIQLVRGPLIELLSIKELETKGVIFSKEVVDLAKSKSESFKHESIGSIDLGLGIHSLHLPE